jgi:hypothetical protein
MTATAPPTSAPATEQWNVNLPAFTAGSGATFDLASTLPASVQRGGTFSVSPAGAPLPAGMTLTASGILSVGSVYAGQTTGIIFMYSLPAS